MKKLLMIFAVSILLGFNLKGYGQTIFSEDFNAGDNAIPVTTLEAESPDNIWTQEKTAASNSWNINVTNYGNTAGAAYIAKSAMTTNNSCLFSPGFTLTADQAYEISFYVRVRSVANGSYNFKMGISDTRASASITELLYSSTVAITGYTKVVVYFIPEETKTYHLAFWENGNTTVTNYYPGGPITDGASIDDIDISQYTGSTTCDAPTDLTLSEQNYSAATFTWTGTADNYNFLLKDKETSKIVFAQTVSTNTISVSRSNFKGSKEYEFGAASVCGPFKSADTAWGASSFTALADTFDYAMKFGYPLEQQNVLIDNLEQIPLYIYNYSTIMISDTFRIKLIIDDTDIYNDSIIGAMISLGWNTNKNISLANALSAGPHKIVAIVSNNKDNYSKNDTAEVNFTIKSKNIALTQILHPTESGIYLTTDTLKVRVKNLNSHDNLTSVTFNVKVNETVLGQYNAYGLNIAPGDSADIKYNKLLDLSEFGDYTITAFLQKDNLDNDQLNDTARITITNNQPAQSFKDMFVTEVTIPTMPVRLTNAESISIKYVNKSGDSVQNFPVILMVNGVTVKTDTIKRFVKGLGETHEYTFTNVDLSEYKEYVIKAFTKLDGDEHPENDTATAETFTNLENSPDLPYFEDFEEEDGWLTTNDLGFASDNWSLFREYSKLQISNDPLTYKFDLAPKYASVERWYGAAYSSWLISKGITLVKGELYKIEFNLYTDTCLTSAVDQPFEKLIVNMGSDKTAAAMTDTLFVTEERLYENEVITMTFTAKETGLYYLGFHAVSPEIDYYSMNNGAAIILVDNVSIKDSVVPAPDAGITAITNPVSSSTLTDEETVTVTVKNFGNIAIENLPVSLTLQGNFVVTDTVIGPIEPGTEVPFTFEQKLDLSARNTYEIEVFTGLENDVNTANDTISVEVIFETLDAGITAITAPASDSPISGSLSNEETVTVTIKNFGNVVIEDIPVSLTLQGEFVVTETVTGPVEPGAEVPFTFDQTIDLSARNGYEIAVFTELENDIDNSNDTFSVTITFTTDMEELENSETVSIYPNPVSDKLFIQSEENIKRAEIYNVQGKLMKVVEGNTREISVSDLKAGVYMLQVRTGINNESRTAILRFIKQ